MKDFFKMMFASALGVFVAIILLTTLSTTVLLGMIATVGAETEYIPKANSVFKLTLSGTLSEVVEENPLDVLLGNNAQELSLNDILKSIELAKQHDNIKGIYIQAGVLIAGPAHIDAIRRALEDFKESGKFLIAYGNTYSQGAYYLCSVADQVIMNPEGTLALRGLTSQTLFYKGLLDKVGVDMMVFKVGTHKGATEPFSRVNLSEENREQITSYQQAIWHNITNGIAESRNITVESVNRFADQGLALSAAENAVEFGLIDALQYRIDLEEEIKALAGQKDKRLAVIGLDKVKAIKEKRNKASDKIAILYAEGEIMPEETPSIYNSNSDVISERMATELLKLRNDDDVKAVVFRVNSPGGSAFISDQIWHQVNEMKEVKPIVVSMGSVAASGGYYISAPANKIVAEKNTITGSIGIFGYFPNATGLFDKIGVSSDIVKTNHFGDFGDITRPMRDDEKALMQSYVEKGYDTFLTRCAEGRGMTKEQINEIGQGRVWTGEQALQIGLVDVLGGIDTAIELAAGLADLDNYSLSHVTGSKDFWKELLEKQLTEIKLSVVKGALGDEYETFRTLRNARANMGIQARLPFDITEL